MISAVQCFETGLWLEGEEWLAWWSPEMDYDDWENARSEATASLIPPPAKPTLAQLLTQKARSR